MTLPPDTARTAMEQDARNHPERYVHPSTQRGQAWPRPDEVWQHRKHTPDEWHRYDILCVTEDSDHPDRPLPQYFSTIHTETDEVLDILHDALMAFGSGATAFRTSSENALLSTATPKTTAASVGRVPCRCLWMGGSSFAV